MRRALSELGPITPADPERPNTRIGRGFGCSMQPYGRSVFFADRASAWIGLEKDGTMVIRAGVTDLGAGQSASLANIAGEVLGITVDRTSVHIGDSALTPLTGGTFATRQLYMSGNAVLKVARALRAKLEPVAAALLECEVTDLTFEQNLVSAGGRSISMGELSRAAEHQSVMPYHHDTFEAETGKFDAETGKGRSFPDCTHGAHAVEVEVDTDTGEVRVLKYVAVHDIGRAINMQRVEGQIQGAVAQGVGYALSEEVEVTGGVVSSTLFADYLIPTAVDLPDIKAIGLELHPGKGPFGARGIGEPPIGPPPAALASAIHDAVGVRLHRLPMTPEHILGALREARVDSPTTASCMTAAKVVPGGAAVALLKPRSEPPSIPAMSVSPRAFHGSMVGYQPTPLRDAPHAARRLGVAEVLVKDESERLGLPSFKVLGASWAVHRALVEHLGSTLEEIPTFDLLAAALARARPLTLAAATDGNHGRAVAHVAALLGLDARIYVPGDMVPARIAAIESEGAAVTVVEGGYDDAVARSAQDAGERCLVISDTSWPGYERVPAWVIEGYSTIFAEIDEALVSAQREQPDAVVVPIGVGALAAAAVRHYWSLQNGRPRLMGVEPTSAACVLESVATGRIVTLEHPQTSIMAGLNCETPSLIAWPLVSRGIDVYLAVPDSYVGDATRLLAADGIVAGECGAAGLAAVTALASDGHLSEAREALGLGPDSRILLLSTEGATDPKAYRRLVGGAS